MKQIKHIFGTLIILLVFISYGCGKNEAKSEADSTTQQKQADSAKKPVMPKVTFVELGSVSCIPCKMMQPVMKAIENEFGDQIAVIFFDVWKDPEPGRRYGIKLIPTQVFLDEKGKEFFRHEGYFPQQEIEKLLTEKGLKKLKQAATKK